MGKSNSKASPLTLLEKSSILQSEARSRKIQVFQKMNSRVFQNSFKMTRAPKLSILSLQPSTLFKILSFISDQLNILLSVSASLYCKILESFDDAFYSLESDFASRYSGILTLNKSFLSSTQVLTSTRSGHRIDRVLVSEVREKLQNLTLTVSYTFKTYSSQATFLSQFKFDCVEPGSKEVWLAKDESHKNEVSRNFKHFKDMKGFKESFRSRALTASIPQISAGDFSEFAVNWYSLHGLIRIDSIKFENPKIEVTGRVVQKIREIQCFEERFYCELLRKAEQQVLNETWIRLECFRQGCCFCHYFEPFLTCNFFEVSTYSKRVFRYFFKAAKSGIVMNCFWRLGVEVQIVESERETVTEVKRKGLCFDRFKPLQLHVGDTIVIYLNK